MTTEETLELFGSKVAIALAANVSPQAVQQWFDNKAIPIARQYQIQVVTKGKLKADAKAA